MAALEEKRWEPLSHVQDQTWRAGLRPAGTWGELEMGEGGVHDGGSLTQGLNKMQADREKDAGWGAFSQSNACGIRNGTPWPLRPGTRIEALPRPCGPQTSKPRALRH